MLRVIKQSEPDCIRGFARYSDLKGTACYQNARRAISNEQHGLCAYCERALSIEATDRTAMSIEHVRPRGLSMYLRFQLTWTNLVGSCRNPKTCTQHKGNQYTAAFLSPVEDDPPRFLELIPSTGEVAPRKGLCARCAQRVEYTLEVLNLNESGLVKARRVAFTDVVSIAAGGVEPAGYLGQPGIHFGRMLSDVFGAPRQEAKDSNACPGCGQPRGD